MTDEIQYFISTPPNRSDLEAVHTLEVEHYPNNEPLVRFEGRYVERILMRPQSLDTFMAGMFWVDGMLERGTLFESPELILPFPFGARQDRLNPSGNYLFTAKSIAEIINQRGFSRVVLLDPHSDVISGMIDRCVYLDPAAIIADPAAIIAEDLAAHFGAPPVWADYDVIICPDAGAGKRAMAVAQLLGKPLIHAWKNRDIATGQISGFGVAMTKKPDDCKKALIVDDCCDGGGTFMGLAAILLPDLAVDLFVTHGIFSQGTDALAEHFDMIYTTDSVLRNPDPNVTVIPICDVLLSRGMI